MEAIRGQNNIISYRWKCNACDSGKIIRSGSTSPYSNLKQHISICHPENLNSFLTLRECNKINPPPGNTVFIQKT